MLQITCIIKLVVVVVTAFSFAEELITYVQILSTLNFSDTTSKFRIVATFIIAAL